MLGGVVKTIYKKLKSDSKYARKYAWDSVPFDLSEELLNARLEKGLTQSELAELAGTSQSAIARIENGNGNPGILTIRKLVFALDRAISIKFPTVDEYIDARFDAGETIKEEKISTVDAESIKKKIPKCPFETEDDVASTIPIIPEWLELNSLFRSNVHVLADIGEFHEKYECHTQQIPTTEQKEKISLVGEFRWLE